MLLRKYISLVYKDLFICKSVAVCILFSILFAAILPRNILESYFYVPAIMIIAIITISTAIAPLWQEEKNKGLELLLTTPCTRKDIVLCRYLMSLLVNLVNLIIYSVSILLFIKQAVFTSLGGSITFFIMCLMLSLIIPISFKFKASTASIMAATIISPLIIISEFLQIENVDSLLISAAIILFSILLIMLSANISLKIYSKKDL